jgi:two-component system response regulator HydG
MKALRQQIMLMAPTNGRVLIYGESGTGKELVAHAIHAQSLRKDNLFVELNCAAIPEDLIESELFGHSKGSFPGATGDKDGKFQKAHGGTLFLDEVGDMSLKTQSKVLRTLDEQRFTPVGSDESVTVDARVIASTNKDLEEEISKGNFREDLFYRLNVIQVVLPPLRDRVEDVPLLADHFIARYSAKNQKPVRGLTREALAAMEGYPWPGNVRELEHAIERAVVLSRGPEIELNDLPEAVRAGGAAARLGGAASIEGRTLTVPLGTTMEEIELRVIRETLRQTKGDKNLAAQLLGIAARTIYRKLERD